MGAARVMAGRPRRRSGEPSGPLSRKGNVDRRRGIRCSERKRRETSDSRCVLQSHNSLPLRLFFHRPDRTGRARALPGRARSSYLIHDVDEPGRARGQDFCSPGFGDLHVRGEIEAPVSTIRRSARRALRRQALGARAAAGSFTRVPMRLDRWHVRRAGNPRSSIWSAPCMSFSRAER